MTNSNLAQPKAHKVAATRCAHCHRALPTGEGVGVPFIGALGPECVQKYAPLLALLQQVQAVTAPTTGELVDPATDFPVWALHRLYALGFEAQIVAEGGLRRVEVQGLRPASRKVTNRAAAALSAFKSVRAEFEQRLQRASADARAEDQAARRPVEIPAAGLDILRDEGLNVDRFGQQVFPLTAHWLDHATQAYRRAEALGLRTRGQLDLACQVYRLQLVGAA